MTLLEAMEHRRSVRRYTGEPLRPEHAQALEAEIARCNALSGLHIQLVRNHPGAFSRFLAHYGWLQGVTDYIALVGTPSEDLSLRCGYYGEQLVLFARTLGLGTCWVAGTYRKGKTAFEAAPGETLHLIIAVGYGEEPKKPRRSKAYRDVTRGGEQAPDWFRAGVRAALLAPTAVNQQKFQLILHPDETVEAKALPGPWTDVDLGIVRYHFELGAGKENVRWRPTE